MSIIYLTPKQSRRVNALIKKLCCNYDNGHCILLDDGEPCVCPQIITYSHILCKWFRIAVLPIDKDLYIELTRPRNTAKCIVCGRDFVKKANNAKYCDNCRKTIRKRKIAEYKKKCINKGNHSKG